MTYLSPSAMAPLSMSVIIRHVAEAYGLPVVMVVGVRRSAIVAEARHVAMWLCKEMLPGRSYPEIARAFRRDHTSVMHGVRRIDKRRDDDDDLRQMLDEMLAELEALANPGIDDAVGSAGNFINGAAGDAVTAANTLCRAVCRAIRCRAAEDPAAFLRDLTRTFGQGGTP